MYSDRTLLPKECLRLCALGTLALSDKPISYADLANSVRHFMSHIMGPSLDMMGSSLQLLKLEGLVKEDTENGAFSDAQLSLTQSGHDKFIELMQGNLRDTSGELSRLIMALKMRFLHLLDDDIRIEQVEILQDVCELDLERVLALREEHADEAATFTGWLEMEVKRLEQKRDWLSSLKK
jgi:DNA-binding PadR family transcriptional regulator